MVGSGRFSCAFGGRQARRARAAAPRSEPPRRGLQGARRHRPPHCLGRPPAEVAQPRRPGRSQVVRFALFCFVLLCFALFCVFCFGVWRSASFWASRRSRDLRLAQKEADRHIRAGARPGLLRKVARGGSWLGPHPRQGKTTRARYVGTLAVTASRWRLCIHRTRAVNTQAVPKRRCFFGRVQASGAARAGGEGEDESEEDDEDEGEDGEADEGSGTEDGHASDDEDADDEDGGTSGSETSAASAVSSDWDVRDYVAGYVGRPAWDVTSLPS